MSRRTAREAAMSILFQYSVTGDASIETIDVMGDVLDSAELTQKNREYIKSIVALFLMHEDEIDSIINEHSHAWKTTRINKADLAILRLSLTELQYMSDIPEKVSVNEAVELAKKYATDNSPRFVNGLLGGYIKNDDV